jgi:uncharacterized protein
MPPLCWNGLSSIPCLLPQPGEISILSVAVAELPRLVENLRSASGELKISLRGMEVNRGKLGLELKISGRLHLTCQRCLEEIPYPLDHARQFCLADSSPENVAEEDPEIDSLRANQNLDVLDLVEEETLLCLPLAPMHETGNCEETSGAREVRQRLSPFAGLYKDKL